MTQSAEIESAVRRTGQRMQWLSVLLLCLAFAGLYASTLAPLGMFGWDEAEYASLGRSVARGDGFTIAGRPNELRPPLLPLSVAASLLVTRHSGDEAASLPMIAFSIMALLVVYGTMRIERDHLTGWIAAAFLGLMPTFWQFTSVLMAEIPFMALFTAAIALFYFGLYRDDRYFYPSWIAVALAMSTRYTAVLFAPISICFALFALRDHDARRRIGRRHFWISPFVGFAVFVPWLVRQQIAFGNAIIGFEEASKQLEMFLPHLSMPWYFYLTHLPTMISLLLCLPLVVGIVWAIQSRDRFALHCLFVVAFILVWFSVYRFKEVRQVTSALPFLAMIAALGLTRATLPRTLTKRWMAGLTVFLVATLGLSFFANEAFFHETVTLGYPSLTEAMRMLRRETPKDAVLMGASVPQIFWYTNRKVIAFPRERDFSKALAGCDWVIVTNFERSQPPWVEPLLGKIDPREVKRGDVRLVRSGAFSTVLIRASFLRKTLPSILGES